MEVWLVVGHYDKNPIQCLLCAHVSKGGIKRQKEHLIGGFGDVTKCPKTTKVISKEMLEWKNRGKKREPKGSLKFLSQGRNNDNGESIDAPQVKKPTPSSSLQVVQL